MGPASLSTCPYSRKVLNGAFDAHKTDNSRTLTSSIFQQELMVLHQEDCQYSVQITLMHLPSSFCRSTQSITSIFKIQESIGSLKFIVLKFESESALIDRVINQVRARLGSQSQLVCLLHHCCSIQAPLGRSASNLENAILLHCSLLSVSLTLNGL